MMLTEDTFEEFIAFLNGKKQQYAETENMEFFSRELEKVIPVLQSVIPMWSLYLEDTK